MSYEPVARADWPAFVESFSRQLEGRRVEIEMMGLDLGVQVEAEWLPLRELRYEPDSDELHIRLANDEEIDHRIDGPSEMWAEIAGGELASLVVLDRQGHKEILRFRAPLELPASVEERGRGGASPS